MKEFRVDENCTGRAGVLHGGHMAHPSVGRYEKWPKVPTLYRGTPNPELTHG